MKHCWFVLGAIVLGTAIRPAAAASPNAAKAFGAAMADVVERVMPAVVVISTEATRYRVAQDRYYGHLYRIPERVAGQGSGVIISKDGFVLTNRHVIDDAQEVEVVLNDGTRYAAELIGSDEQIDLAVLRIRNPPAGGFPHVEPGDSDVLRVGEFVMALGSPFSLSSSVTLGIVSQKGRAIGALPFEDFIQTDAAVNRGNSGGPLVDMDGKLVGINTMIQTSGRSEGNIGISFAIPVNLAMAAADSIQQHGRWQRPWIGIRMDEVEDRVSVMQVDSGSPAEKAGLRAGDRLLAVRGKPATDVLAVRRAVTSGPVGESFTIRYERNGKSAELTVTPAPLPVPDRFFRE
jgi:serine protease Do